MSAKKKIIIVVGTRPNFIKITQFEKVFATHGDYFDFKLVHTGQHFDYNMSDVFFSQLKIKKPDYFLGISESSPIAQMGQIMIKIDQILDEFVPDLVMVVGDVNSTFAAAFASHRKGFKVAHIESGLRSNDRAMPEEINRILTDEISDFYFVTELSGVKNLKDKQVEDQKIFFCGNTMIDTLVAFDADIKADTILEKLKVDEKKFGLVTIHRPSNVDDLESLKLVINLIEKLSQIQKVVFPIHPRTLKKADSFGLSDKIKQNKNIVICEPLDYFAFQKLILSASYILTDSGGIQEETTFRQVPCLTLRKNTERPSTIELGTNELLEFDIHKITSKVHQIIAGNFKKGNTPPLWDGKSTVRIVDILKKIL